MTIRNDHRKKGKIRSENLTVINCVKCGGNLKKTKKTKKTKKVWRNLSFLPLLLYQIRKSQVVYYGETFLKDSSTYFLVIFMFSCEKLFSDRKYKSSDEPYLIIQ